MLKLTCKIEIGNYVFYNVNNISVDLSRNEMVGRATILLARRYKSNNIQQVIKEGDPVLIELGYDGDLRKEFRGYVSRIGANTPVQIDCIDEMYKLMRTPVDPVSWKKVTLEGVIRHVAPEATIQVQNIDLSPYYIRGTITAAKVIESIKDQYGLDAYYKADGTLYVGLPYGEYESTRTPKVSYNTELNVIDKRLQYQRAESTRIKLKLISILPDGSKLTYEAGDPDGEVRTRHEYNLTLQELKSIADERLKLYKTTGLKGSVTTFGIPAVSHGMIADISDPQNPEYNGAYLIDGVTVTYGMRGYRREVQLGKKVS